MHSGIAHFHRKKNVLLLVDSEIIKQLVNTVQNYKIRFSFDHYLNLYSYQVQHKCTYLRCMAIDEVSNGKNNYKLKVHRVCNASLVRYFKSTLAEERLRLVSCILEAGLIFVRP